MDFKIREIETVLNAFEVYNLFKNQQDTILLDSSKEDSKLSRFSFIGLNSYKTFKAWGNKIEVDGRIYEGDPFEELEKLVMEYSFKYESKLPLVAGCLGYFSYDIGRTIEKLPNTSSEDFIIPDAYFIFYDNIIIFDLKEKKTYITALGIQDSGEETINNIYNIIKKGTKIEETEFSQRDTRFYSNFTREGYIEAVGKVKEYIRSGDVYIANLTQRMWCHCEKDSFEIYKDIRTINKAPFAAYLNLKDVEIISSSPERFIKIENSIIETRPIKGTRPRGKTPEEDEENKEELKNSEKDKSELLMIVDLERNDLSKICNPHSVKVTELFNLETYATVFHLVSTIIGKLAKGCSGVKVMRECFPGGSITGAPKIRAMEIIEELEGVKRNLYTGSIGYFDFRGNADFNIVIRTIVKKDNKAYFGVGGGITIDSIEEMEYEETIDKAKALMRVL